MENARTAEVPIGETKWGSKGTSTVRFFDYCMSIPIMTKLSKNSRH